MGTTKRNTDNPFPGLRPFRIDDIKLFFGREAEIRDVTAKLLNNRYVTVLGASGTGKSSLILCGVISKIRSLIVTNSSAWKVAVIRPGNDPFRNLASALTDEFNSPDSFKVFAELNAGSELLKTINSIKSGNEKVLIVIDQFEDLFRYSDNDASKQKAKDFSSFLVNSLAKADPDVYFLFILRSEYMGECSHYWELARIINNSNYIVPEPDVDAWKEIVRGPVNNSGGAIDAELVEKVLNDVRFSNDQFPVLQHAMMRTWAHWCKKADTGKSIGIDDYESVGTIKNSISIHADEIYISLSERDREICTVLFRTITRKGPHGKGIRAAKDFETIKLIAVCSHAELSGVIEKFAEASFISRYNSLVDIQNECLIFNWERLKDWIEDEAYSRMMYLQISESSALYQQGKKGLIKHPELQEAINWREKYKPGLYWGIQYNAAFERTMVYLRTSESTFVEEEKNKSELQKKAHKRGIMLTSLAVIIISIAIGLAIFGYIQKHKAELSSEIQKSEAVKLKLQADSSVMIALKQKMLSDSTAEAAISKSEESNRQKEIAEKRIMLTQQIADDASRQKNLALAEKENARRLRMLSVGKAMSLKSLQLSGQKDLQALLAFQAYLFNKTNKGAENEPDIYAGLYNTAIQNGNINYKSFKGHQGEIKSIVFVPGKNQFFTSGTDGKVLKWAQDNQNQALQVMYSGNDITEVLAVSPDASWLACGSSNSSIRMIPLKGNNMSYEMTGHTGEITSLIYSFDGKYLYSAALDGKVLKWDIAARTSVNVGTGASEISSLDISSNGNFLAGISTDGNVLVWSPGNNIDNFRIETTGKKIKVIRFNPDRNLLAIGDMDGKIEIWDVENQIKISEFRAHESQINDIQFNTKPNQLATTGNDKKIKIFSAGEGWNFSEPPIIFNDIDDFVMVMKFSTDGQLLISGGTGNNNLLGRAANVEYLAGEIRSLVTRNMTAEEWNIYVGKDIPQEKTIQNVNIKVEPRISVNKK